MEDNMSKITEQELAEPIVAWLMAEGWDVYQEVTMYAGGPIVDIVARNEAQNTLWAIECKLSMTAAVCGQAYRLQGLSRFHKVSVAVPLDSNGPTNVTRQFLRQGLKAAGIGIVYLRHDLTTGKPKVFEHTRGKRVLDSDLVPLTLKEEQRTWAQAGNAEGKRWTPFQQTVENVKAFLYQRRGDTFMMKDIVADIEHHYSSDTSASNALRIWITTGKVPGIRTHDSITQRALVYYLDWEELNIREAEADAG